MPKVVVIAEQHLVFTREIEVTEAELAELQARIAQGGQDDLHLVGEDYLGNGTEHVLEDSGYEDVRLELR